MPRSGPNSVLGKPGEKKGEASRPALSATEYELGVQFIADLQAEEPPYVATDAVIDRPPFRTGPKALVALQSRLPAPDRRHFCPCRN
jgi:hypothetical protein